MPRPPCLEAARGADTVLCCWARVHRMPSANAPRKFSRRPKPPRHLATATLRLLLPRRHCSLRINRSCTLRLSLHGPPTAAPLLHRGLLGACLRPNAAPPTLLPPAHFFLPSVVTLNLKKMMSPSFTS
mmetsp:Transcript_70398/g.211723  ORF Transcript_70398/g.211723 Transcript_70398/m.211723 type:complete len:128 (-) Transcript_70398:1172-1555(-)